MFTLTKESVRLADVNGRHEFHGDDRVLCADLKFEAKLHNAVLLKFSDTLRDAFYTTDPGATVDMLNPEHAPKLRHPEITDFKWNLSMIDVRLGILEDGSNDEELIFAGCKCNKFTVNPQEGGTVVLGFLVRAQKIEAAELTRLICLQDEMLKINMEVIEPAPDSEGSESQAQSQSGPDLLSEPPAGEQSAPAASPEEQKPSTDPESDFEAALENAKAVVNGVDKISLKGLIREMKISDALAARILFKLEEVGVLSQAGSNGVRQVLVPAL